MIGFIAFARIIVRNSILLLAGTLGAGGCAMTKDLPRLISALDTIDSAIELCAMVGDYGAYAAGAHRRYARAHMVAPARSKYFFSPTKAALSRLAIVSTDRS